MAIQQVRMMPAPDPDGGDRLGIEVTIQRPGRMLRGQWHPSHETTWHGGDTVAEAWGLALAYVNGATAVLHGPQGTNPPSGVAPEDAGLMAEARAA